MVFSAHGVPKSVEREAEARGEFSELARLFEERLEASGDPEVHARRVADLSDYQVNAALMARARPHAVFMHCLPAKRGEEVTDDVMDSPYSIIVEQAANRMHVQKALMEYLLLGRVA